VTVREKLKRVRMIRIPKAGPAVEKTAARELCERACPSAQISDRETAPLRSEAAMFNLAVMAPSLKRVLERMKVKVPHGREWVYFGLDNNGCFWLLASRPAFLYAGLCDLLENLLDAPARPFRRLRPMSFGVEKSTFDIFLTQYARLMRGLDRRQYIREYARLGFTHIEVNALAGPFPFEQGSTVPGEFYPDFYTYAPALDQFVSSRLNQGLYPREYLEANLVRLKDNARLAVKFGLVPGLLCFEPRTVPETFFQKYPTLRGARVDHPFRSFKPRYTLSLVHPAVRKHYAELVRNLLRHVPELGFLSIWSNDSGSGFEHTKSLYVGRNGGAYLIREWKDDDAIARLAADNIGRFFQVLRDAGAGVNPKFRVATRLESFYGERRHLWPWLRDRVDVEVNSLLTSGWENNYPHPTYPDIQVLGSGLHHGLRAEERKTLLELAARGSRTYFYHYFGAFANHEPLLGIPFPWLVREKLEACRKAGVRALAHHGGIQPPGLVPYAVNQEVFRAFQFEPGRDIDLTVADIAARYAGPLYAPLLVRGWRLIDEAVRSFPPMSIYSIYGVVWQRLFVRPLVPDIDRIPEAERRYYEDFMCASVHNPNKVDLGRDVLFELLSKTYAGSAVRRIDKNVWKPLDAAQALFKKTMDECSCSGDAAARRVFEDQYYRVRALRCLMMTLRNTAAWVYAVHDYLKTGDARKKREARAFLRSLMKLEVKNTRELQRLWREAPLEWMIVSGTGETPFIYGENFPDLLEKKLGLMKKYGGAEPRVDPDYMFRLAADPYRRSDADERT
jgi:hypothetical protein